MHRFTVRRRFKSLAPTKKKVLPFGKTFFLVVLASLKLNIPVTRPAPSTLPRVPVPVRRRVGQWDRDEIVRLYESGLSSRAVAQRVGIAKSSVLRILKEAGVEMRPRGVRY